MYVPVELSLAQPVRVPAVPARGCSLWWADVPAQRATAERLAPGLLDDGELRRAATFIRQDDRHRYRVAHVALRQLLGALLDLAPDALRFVREPCPCCGAPHGRPALDDAAAGFSLSHSGDLVLIALAAEPVGVDVERYAAAGAVRKTMAALHPRETAELGVLPEELLPAAFARAWARKEAYLKGIGTGLGRGPELDYVGTGIEPAPGPAGWSLADVRVAPGYAAAVALRAPGSLSSAAAEPE